VEIGIDSTFFLHLQYFICADKVLLSWIWYPFINFQIISDNLFVCLFFFLIYFVYVHMLRAWGLQITLIVTVCFVWYDVGLCILFAICLLTLVVLDLPWMCFNVSLLTTLFHCSSFPVFLKCWIFLL
jgi:hypothetical protein